LCHESTAAVIDYILREQAVLALRQGIKDYVDRDRIEFDTVEIFCGEAEALRSLGVFWMRATRSTCPKRWAIS